MLYMTLDPKAKKGTNHFAVTHQEATRVFDTIARTSQPSPTKAETKFYCGLSPTTLSELTDLKQIIANAQAEQNIDSLFGISYIIEDLKYTIEESTIRLIPAKSRGIINAFINKLHKHELPPNGITVLPKDLQALSQYPDLQQFVVELVAVLNYTYSALFTLLYPEAIAPKPFSQLIEKPAEKTKIQDCDPQFGNKISKLTRSLAYNQTPKYTSISLQIQSIWSSLPQPFLDSLSVIDITSIQKSFKRMEGGIAKTIKLLKKPTVDPEIQKLFPNSYLVLCELQKLFIKL
jgi:hypothetical protein